MKKNECTQMKILVEIELTQEHRGGLYELKTEILNTQMEIPNFDFSEKERRQLHLMFDHLDGHTTWAIPKILIPMQLIPSWVLTNSRHNAESLFSFFSQKLFSIKKSINIKKESTDL